MMPVLEGFSTDGFEEGSFHIVSGSVEKASDLRKGVASSCPTGGTPITTGGELCQQPEGTWKVTFLWWSL